MNVKVLLTYWLSNKTYISTGVIMKRRAFTLIELLVTISIISVLAAILFPVFARARENARRASCMSNMKQIGLGVMMYVQDYDEKYPLYRRETTQPPPFPVYKTDYWEWQHMIFPYTKSEQLYWCPSGNDYRAYNGNYGANYSLIRNTSTSLANVDATASTYMIMDAGTSYILTTDAYRVNKGGARYLPGSGQFVTPESAVSSGWYESDFNNGRHFGGVNMIFADGHVKWLKSEVVLSESKKTDGAWTP